VGARGYSASGVDAADRDSHLAVRLAFIDLQQGYVDRAAQGFVESLCIDQMCGSVMMMPSAIAHLSRCAALQGDVVRAAVLAGGADALLSHRADRWAWGGEEDRDMNIGELRAQLGGEFDRAYAEGRDMAADDIVRLAIRGIGRSDRN